MKKHYKLGVPAWMAGQSLVPLMKGNKVPSRHALSMVIESTPQGHLITEGTFAVWEGDFKLIHYLKEDKSMLFNLKKDPGKLIDLVEKEPELSLRILKVINESLEGANARKRTACKKSGELKPGFFVKFYPEDSSVFLHETL